MSGMMSSSNTLLICTCIDVNGTNRPAKKASLIISKKIEDQPKRDKQRGGEEYHGEMSNRKTRSLITLSTILTDLPSHGHALGEIKLWSARTNDKGQISPQLRLQQSEWAFCRSSSSAVSDIKQRCGDGKLLRFSFRKPKQRN